MKDLILFEYEEKEVRVSMDEEGNPWWVAKDVCAILEHTNHRVAVEALDEDEKGVRKVYSPGGEQDTLVISESGLYTLIIRSNKPEARKFRRWVTHEVLPSIRKTGGYAMAESLEETGETRKLLMLARLYERSERIFRALTSIAKTAGYRGQLAVARANRATRERTGIDCLALIGAQYLSDESFVVAFVDACCLVHSAGAVRCGELFNAYKEWCEQEGVAWLGRNIFYREICAHYADVRRTVTRWGNRAAHFEGIGLK